MQKEGEDRRKKKKDGSLCHIACGAESVLGSQMCVIPIKLSKLKGHLTPLLPSLILSPSPFFLPLSVCVLLHACTHTHAHSHTVHTYTLPNFFLFFPFFKGTCWEGSFMMFCNSSVALGCKTHLCAARRGIVGYLIWCGKGWWMLFACCTDVSNSSLNASSAGTDCDCMVGEQTSVSDDISHGPLYYPGWDAWVCAIKTSLSLYIRLSPTPPSALLSNIRMRACLCVQVPRPRRLLHFMAVIC